jgi:hypothetical protein
MSRLSSVLIFIFAFLFSCQKNQVNENHSLLFSADTVYFDTVFATIGSITRELRVKNGNNQKLTIDEIYLAGGTKSQFRLNIDGEPGWSKKKVEIEPGDSIFIFVDVNVNPTNQDSPLAVTDSITFRAGGNTFEIQLLAWGQDINLFENKIIGTQAWNKQKPYVIYGTVLVDTLATLTVGEGSRINFHSNSSMKVAGTLVVNGTLIAPVVFAGDRLEKMYKDIPGQWHGIGFLDISSGNKIDHAEIRNSVNGLSLGESNYNGLTPDLQIMNSSVMHSTVTCLSSVHGKIKAANLIFSHTGKYCINLSSGGDYSFTHCTIYNQWNYGFRLTPSVYVSEKADQAGGDAGNLILSFNNCVIYGDLVSELNIIPSGITFTGNYLMDHCLFKLDTLQASFWSAERFKGTIINKDPEFIDPLTYDFRPDTLSPLIDMGNPVYGTAYPYDFRGESRTKDGKPDIGAFERIAGELKKNWKQF